MEQQLILTEALSAEIRQLGDRYGIRNIRVFGSLARGTADLESDIDLLVEYVPDHGGFAFVDFCDAVEGLLRRGSQDPRGSPDPTQIRNGAPRPLAGRHARLRSSGRG
jgi:predicted nucleotidyltransferase